MEKVSKYANFEFNDSDSDLIDDLSDYLDNNVKEIFNFFEITPNNKVKISIISTKQEYDKIFEERYKFTSPSSRGFYSNGRIYFLSFHDYKNTPHSYIDSEKLEAFEDFKKTLVHEFVHYINELFYKKHNCSYTAKYLVEGIAIYLSHQKDNKNVEFNFTLDMLLDKNCPYSAYYLITKYLIENYDKSFVLELFQSSRQANEFLKQELFKKAKDYYSKTASQNF